MKLNEQVKTQDVVKLELSILGKGRKICLNNYQIAGGEWNSYQNFDLIIFPVASKDIQTMFEKGLEKISFKRNKDDVEITFEAKNNEIIFSNIYTTKDFVAPKMKGYTLPVSGITLGTARDFRDYYKDEESFSQDVFCSLKELKDLSIVEETDKWQLSFKHNNGIFA